MIVCHVCGTENPDGAKFCEGCGVELQAASSASSVPMDGSSAPAIPEPTLSAMPPVEETPGFTSEAPVETPPLGVSEAAEPSSAAPEVVAAPVVQPAEPVTPPAPAEPDIKATMPDTPVVAVTTPAVAEAPKVARLVPRGASGGESFTLSSDQMVVGRFDPSAGPVDIDLAGHPGENYISRRHAELYLENGVWLVRDLGSTNGVYVKKAGQGQYSPRLTEPSALGDGDEVAFGNVKFVFLHSSEG
jgi:pSer/pThr/pTyr-binding forkhead associated (FHA) protein